jgi:tripartite-type tricarboxylate transporter receptor subunit TctC
MKSLLVWLKPVAAAAIAAFASISAAQQTFPSRNVTIVVPYAPGGGHDATARLLADRLSARWGKPVIVENRAGANGMIGAESVARSAPDGHTIMMASPAEIVIAPSAYKSMRYDPAKDLAPVTLAGVTPLVLVAHPSVKARTLPEVIELARREKGKLSFGTAGAGSSQHLAGEWLNQLAGIDLQHVGYKGAGPATTDVLGGQIPFVIVGMAPVAQHIKSGRLNAIAVTTRARLSFAPDIPTFAEVPALKDFEVSHWMGILAPGSTPGATVKSLNDSIVAVLKEPAIVERLRDMGVDPLGNSPDEFAAYLEQDRSKFARLFQQAGLTPQ